MTTDEHYPLVDNLGGYQPPLGSSGFGNSCNNYGWVIETVGEHLFVGTMDYCTLFDPSDPAAGADLWCIDGLAGDAPVAVPETTTAFKAENSDIYTHSP